MSADAKEIQHGRQYPHPLGSVVEDFSRFSIVLKRLRNSKGDTVQELIVNASPEAFERALEEFRHWYNHEHYHKGIGNLHPADVYFGRSEAIFKQRQLLKEQTKMARKKANLRTTQKPRKKRNLRTKTLQ